MDKETARDKFGKMVENEDGTERWMAEPNKIRGIIVRWARDVDEIRAPAEDPEPPHYIGDLWEWTEEKLGDGFEGVFRGEEMSPSGKFDRVSEDRMMTYCDGLYGNNKEFTEIIDEKWVHDEEAERYDEFDPVDVDLSGEMGRYEAVHHFYEGTNKRYPAMPNKQAEPDISTYKYHMKRHAVTAQGIPHDDDEPSAEAFVESWVEYLRQDVFVTAIHIVSNSDDPGGSGQWPVPTKEQVAKWARELWSDDDEFRENLIEKWGDERAEPTDGDNMKEKKISAAQKDKSRNKRGQQSLGDY